MCVASCLLMLRCSGVCRLSIVACCVLLVVVSCLLLFVVWSLWFWRWLLAVGGYGVLCDVCCVLCVVCCVRVRCVLCVVLAAR